MTILEISEQIRTGAVSPVELTRECLSKIETLNPKLNAFITVMAESALGEAQRAEQQIQTGGWRGPLHGIPIGLKDLIDTAGVRTTAGSAVFKNRIPDRDAEVVRRLRAAGALIVGKQNLHEFAYGGSSMISYFGEVRNAWNPAHITGGSSGGSATAVAAGMCYGAIGTDTAGSIREPAALCGVVGLKPTYGRVSARGVIPLAASLDHVGPITASGSDAAILLRAIGGYDDGDASSVDVPVEDYVRSLPSTNAKLRIGVPRKYFYDDLDPQVAAAVEEALRELSGLVAELREVSLDVPTDRTLQSAESYAYHREMIANQAELYQAETLRRIRSGENVSQEQYRKVKDELLQTRAKARDLFREVDLLVTPTTPVAAPTIRDVSEKPESLRPAELLLLRNTRPFNVWGLPAISVPCGFTDAGLPIGLQIAGPHWSEPTVLSLAYAYEQVTEWHRRRPPFERRNSATDLHG
jgi:aspartyl-tRNA(Asn)/glutamyl-tRNA(Gln) amidotransferase subunit A